MTTINTNISSLHAQAALTSNSRGLQTAMESLSTGKRINSASDDAAGLTISVNFTGQIKSLRQAVRNANDGISMVQTFEGATNAITNMLQRMRELAIQASNSTYASSDRTNLDAESKQLIAQIATIASNTKWNGQALLAGSVSTVTFQLGAASSDSVEFASSVYLGDASSTGLGSGLIGSADVDLSTSTGAISALDTIDTAISNVSSARAGMGAMINRLSYAADNLTNTATHLSESRSRIEDTDYSEATAELSKRQVIQQAATAMLAQANQQPQMVLQLLK